MVLAILAVVKVNEPVTCMEHFHFYHPPLVLMYAEVINPPPITTYSSIVYTMHYAVFYTCI